ncbi:hypothetical protein OESDEN_16196 [Oesophagostomum dentatum]|uniref:Uncharacterized protein n=1 Tax=Oesophagostomum dentatum TaxID=61180 RepID=A0A0B1SGR0_OESDE|nr:hypothetical protein OESDEN_16196 [Oesophagostomum dentatum]
MAFIYLADKDKYNRIPKGGDVKVKEHDEAGAGITIKKLAGDAVTKWKLEMRNTVHLLERVGCGYVTEPLPDRHEVNHRLSCVFSKNPVNLDYITTFDKRKQP